MRRPALWLVIAAIFVAPGAEARADLYRWVDDTGAVHYTTERDEVPRAYRDAAQEIQKPPARRAVRRTRAAPPPPPAPTSSAAPDGFPSDVPIAPPGAPAPPTESPALIGPPTTVPPTPSAPSALPGPPSTTALAPDDPRAAEVAELEAKIAADRETLRQMISTPRWDSAELASDPKVREVAERLPRLQAELDALLREPAP